MCVCTCVEAALRLPLNAPCPCLSVSLRARPFRLGRLVLWQRCTVQAYQSSSRTLSTMRPVAWRPSSAACAAAYEASGSVSATSGRRPRFRIKAKHRDSSAAVQLFLPHAPISPGTHAGTPITRVRMHRCASARVCVCTVTGCAPVTSDNLQAVEDGEAEGKGQRPLRLARLVLVPILGPGGVGRGHVADQDQPPGRPQRAQRREKRRCADCL
jgi:hypothetical protein